MPLAMVSIWWLDNQYCNDYASSTGWMYTMWAALMLISGILTLLVMRKGVEWREAGEAREAQESEKAEAPVRS